MHPEIQLNLYMKQAGKPHFSTQKYLQKDRLAIGLYII